ncbi:regulatory protein RecX [Sphingomonas montanisoli]|uniref:Regulatory protein RecX n=1 Tax=Sphingomonas montanisoli TaxID=2606412 RepID=A0A5D9C3I8_9SPHN|nr:RecX family transcriptional regulator [Sphingomonas montanisoli]TZG26239.1 RecX family transcriptional regulator [Sphingomonas montanisoli]
MPYETRKRGESPTSRPYDRAGLDRIALAYVGRYATTRAKLADYLRRKLRQHGWAEDGSAPIDAIVERMTELRYVDDEVFARSRAESLSRRGYGGHRIAAALAAAGVDRDMAADVAPDEDQAEAAATAFARRRRIGPFATAPADRESRNRALAAMLRAGHDSTIARRIVDLDPSLAGTEQDD